VTENIRIEAVEPRRIEEFIRVPYGLYRGLANWVPPLLLERRMALKPGATAYLRRAETAFWIARRDGRPVGRISAQIDPRSVERHPGVGHFGLIAAEDDAETVRLLLRTAEDWLKARGMKTAVGPMNLSVNEELGLLVDGFDTPPMMMMPHDPPYLGRHIEAAGYAKAVDLYAYVLDYSHGFNPRMNKFVKRAFASGITVRPLDRRDYMGEVRRVVEIFNDAWRDNWGFIPFSEEEIGQLAGELKPLLVDKLVQFAEMNGEAVGFIVCLPNLNEAIADLNGKIFPFGWMKLLWRLKVKGLHSGRVLLMGIRHRVTGNLLAGMLPFLLVGALEPESRRRGLATIEISWILETNAAMCSIAELICGKPYKTNRMYERPLG
jgi:hypothetical protein